MTDYSKCIGERDAQGRVTRYPETSLAGNPNYEMPPTQVHHLGDGRFVVLDMFPPRGFDTNAVLLELKTSLKTPLSRKVTVSDGTSE